MTTMTTMTVMMMIKFMNCDRLKMRQDSDDVDDDNNEGNYDYDDDDGDGHGYFKESRCNTANGRWSLDSNKHQNGQMELMQWMMDL